ncbi:MAG: TlpA disulfide reductase family protein, partial [Novosphingobium sp.]
MMIKKLLLAAGLSLLCTFSLAKTLTPLQTPREAPGFQLPDLEGSLKHLDDFKGHYLLVNFWAVLCTPCRAEMPSMQRLYETLGDDWLTGRWFRFGASGLLNDLLMQR